MKSREILVEIYNIIKRARECLEHSQHALVYNSLKTLSMADEQLKDITSQHIIIENALKDRKKGEAGTEMYVSASQHLGKLRGNIQTVLDSVREKISKGVLFSDKSISEVHFLLERNSDLLNHIADLVLVKNTLIMGYVKEVEASIAMSVDSYETRHEEQLIEGIAPTQPSKLFVQLLNSIRSITWNSLRVAEELMGAETEQPGAGQQAASRTTRSSTASRAV